MDCHTFVYDLSDSAVVEICIAPLGLLINFLRSLLFLGHFNRLKCGEYLVLDERFC